MAKFFLLALSALLFVSAPKASMAEQELNDPYLWLEEVESPRSLDFAKSENELTLKALQATPRYAGIESDLRKIILAKDRMPGVTLLHGQLYNFWQDAEHVRGIWRRTSAESYRNENPEWETVLDLDAIAKEENESWVWKGSQCLPSAEQHCLITLSRGGKDASVIREFNLDTKKFVADGFVVPEAKSDISWLDENTLYVGTDFGADSLSESGYPIVAKLWKRGTPLSSATEVFRGEKSDVGAGTSVDFRPEGSYVIHSRLLTFFTSKHWIELNGRKLEVPMPESAVYSGAFDGHLLFTLRDELKTASRSFASGSLVALPIGRIAEGDTARESLSLVFAPSQTRFLVAAYRTRSTILLQVLDNVKGKLLKVTRGGGRWKVESLSLGENGMAAISSVDSLSDDFIASYVDFLTPTSLYFGNALRMGKGFTLLKSAKARFDASDMTSEQLWATSKDGTKVPYFVIHKKDMALDGKNPTLLYGYGGFEIPMTPSYLNATGKVWLEKGGVYVLANIRGGGEFGPEWHKAAQGVNHQRAFDDFIAIAEDLIARKITSPAHLGIRGGSNGGLLTGATFVQRPDLFNAVLVEVPLLDMLRYHLLLAGASWVGEYGNPEDPVMREAILKYSPYQNVRKDQKYPEVFFLTSTKDDRVHPAHARKMAARMREQGHPIFYFENTEGGHGGSANLEQQILWSSLEFSYLFLKLGR